MEARILLEDSSLHPGIAVVVDLAAFNTLTGSIPAVFSIHFGHSCYIANTLLVFQLHSVWILTAFVQRLRFGALPPTLCAL